MFRIKIQGTEMHSLIIADETMHTASKQWHCISITVQKEDTLLLAICSTRYIAVQINNCLKRISAIKVATMKITDDFCYNGSHHVPITKSTPFVVSKDEWGTGKSMKNALYVLWYGKRHLSG